MSQILPSYLLSLISQCIRHVSTMLQAKTGEMKIILNQIRVYLTHQHDKVLDNPNLFSLFFFFHVFFFFPFANSPFFLPRAAANYKTMHIDVLYRRSRADLCPSCATLAAAPTTTIPARFSLSLCLCRSLSFYALSVTKIAALKQPRSEAA